MEQHVTVDRFALQLSIREFPGSNLNPARVFVVFFSPPGRFNTVP